MARRSDNDLLLTGIRVLVEEEDSKTSRAPRINGRNGDLDLFRRRLRAAHNANERARTRPSTLDMQKPINFRGLPRLK
jgi:hypothetical protein